MLNRVIKKLKSSRLKTNPAVSFNTLDVTQQQQFTRILHNQQLDIFNEVLVPSLLTLRDSMTKIVLGQDNFGRQVTLFDTKLNELLHGLIKLNEILYTDGLWDISPRRNILLTVFVFYRILYRDLLSKLMPAESITDPYLLIKRIPPKLLMLSGAEYWRLYELSVVIYAKSDDLLLNADLKKIFNIIFAQTEDFIDVDSVGFLKEKSAVSDKQANQFITWLEDNLSNQRKGFKLNMGNYVYASTLRFGQNNVFITQKLLDDYCEQREPLDANELIKNLQVLNHASSVLYEAKQNDNFIPVFKLTVSIELFEESKPVTIVEKSDGN